MKVFLVEDDQSLSKMIRDHLQRYHYEVHTVKNFAAILEEFQQLQPSMVLMDVNLPYFDGFYWCRKVRELSLVPILFLSARDSHMDQVLALEYGADDYLIKPFSNDLLLAKMNSHTRRVYGVYVQTMQTRIVKVGDLLYCPETLKVTYCGQETVLTFREGELLDLLLTAYPKVVSRERILTKLWDDERFVDDNTLSVNMGRLRKKLFLLGMDDAIQTIRGKGYVISIEGKEA